VAEEHWVSREKRVKEEIKKILFGGPGRHVIVGPSGSGKTSTVKMVAREAKRNGIVFVDLKKAKSGTSVMQVFADAFGVDAARLRRAVPHAARRFHKATGRFVTVIIEDAQVALRAGGDEAYELLQILAECTEANAVNLVFLSSEGDLPTQLRSMSGWSNAVEEYGLNLVNEDTVRKHLVEVWKLDAQLAAEIVERIGCGMRDVFKRVLKDFKPGASIDATSADLIKANIKIILEQAKRNINTVLKGLKEEEHSAATNARGSRRAAILLLDYLLTHPPTPVSEVYRSCWWRHLSVPPEERFIHAERILIENNILRMADGENATWHRRPVQAAYAALQRGEVES
jgi:hypothetical protein